MQITLCLDFGNTRKKAGLFHNDEIKEAVVLNDDSIDTVQSIINQFKPQKSILSSVINHNAEIETILSAQT